MSIRLVAPLLALALVPPLAPAAAQDPSAMSCGQLWHRKNALLKAKGLCFSDPRAARTFGNDGCTIRDPNQVPLTSAERQTMARILLAERIKMCR
ncbi:MAG: YARHG domain-containing protein [Hyphomicrobiales bacterium]|nr:YARHG domain-containing protein [Hyphomicrobiales bacterium]